MKEENFSFHTKKALFFGEDNFIVIQLVAQNSFFVPSF